MKLYIQQNSVFNQNSKAIDDLWKRLAKIYTEKKNTRQI